MEIDNLGQTIFIVTFFVVIVLSMVFSTYIYQKIQGPLENSSFATNQSISAYNKFNAAWPLFDHASIVILVMLVAGVLVSAFVIPTHPIFVIGNLLVMAVEVFVSFVLTNAFYAITAVDPNLTSIVTTNYPISLFIVTHLPIFTIAISTLSCIIMFSHGHRTEGAY